MDVTGFLTTMAALSAAVQTFIDHVIKGRIGWLDEPKDSKAEAAPNHADRKKQRRLEETRQSIIHLISFALGALIAWTAGVYPLVALGLSGGVADAHSKLANCLAAGLLVSFGGSFFNEALDAVRAFKKVQEGLRHKQVSDTKLLPNVIS